MDIEGRPDVFDVECQLGAFDVEGLRARSMVRVCQLGLVLGN